MNITRCVPLAGQGVIARSGSLVAVTDGRGPGPDPLLGAVAETAEAGGDGSELVIRVARAALGSRPAAWACAGVTADGGLAVLVHGQAAATVRIGDGPEITLTASDSMLPASRMFTGENITVILVIGGAAPPDERFRLGDGVVPGGGLAVTVTANQPATAYAGGPALPRTPDAQAPQPAQPPEAAGASAVGWDEAPLAVTAQDLYAVDRGAVPAAEPAAAGPGAGGWGPVDPVTVGWGQVNRGAADQGGADQGGSDWGAGDWDAAGGSAYPDQGGWHPPTLDTPSVGTPGPGQQAAEPEGNAVVVDGVLCANGHFNDPGAWSCRQCGIAMEHPPRHFERRPRPPLGELVLDDGTRIPLDGDYVLGREPALDGDVLSGLARPMRINDPNGTVSRLHLKVSLVGWQVEISDLGSANGSVLHSPDGERTLAPFEPVAIEPGARIGIGHRSMQYLAYQGA